MLIAGLILLIIPAAYVVIQPIAPANQVGRTEPPIVRGTSSPIASGGTAPTSSGPVTSASPSPTGAIETAIPSSTPLSGTSTSASDPSVAGYVVGGSAFQAVAATWVVPVIACGSVQRRAVATWIGIGTTATGATQRVGVTLLCLGGHTLQTFAWYQASTIAAPVRLPVPVGGGDQVSAQVSLEGGTYRFNLVDDRSGARGQAAGPSGATAGDTVSWLVDARPLGCQTGCTGVTLADFGRLTFSQAEATGHAGPGTIGQPLWSRARVTMTTAAGQPRASTSGLSGGGAVFAVDWLQP